MEMISNICRLSKHDVEIWKYEDHWGELPSKTVNSLPPEVCKTVIMGAVKHEKPKDYFPELFSSIFQMKEEDGLILPPDACPVNEVIRHTIKLNLYCKKLQRCIKLLVSRKAEIRAPNLQELRKIPEIIRKEKPQRFYRFNLGQCVPMPSLDQELVHKMLEKSVIVILAQVGYDRTRKAALDILVDVIKEMLIKVCLFCHAFAQNDLNRGQVSYSDVLEKSLRTVGLDGIHSVKDYYRKKILIKRDRALARSKRLLVFYEKLLVKHGLNTTGDNIPEIHIPAGVKQNSVVLHASLKPGYEMLQTFDQEVQQNNSGGPKHQ